MNLRDWMHRAIGGHTWGRMESTLPGAMSKAIDQLLYNWCDEGSDKCSGKILKLRNAEKMYVGFHNDWPKWEGKLDANYVDIRQTLRQIQYLLEAYAFAETHQEHAHVCKHCGSAAP